MLKQKQKEEYLKFADAMMDSPTTHSRCLRSGWCGIREGELLTPAGFDFEKNTVRFQTDRAVQRGTQTAGQQSGESKQNPDEKAGFAMIISCEFNMDTAS